MFLLLLLNGLEVGETAVIGLLGYVLLRLGFHPAPILLGFVLGLRRWSSRRYARSRSRRIQ